MTNRVFNLNEHLPYRHRKRNIAWILRSHGYTTGAIVTNPLAHPVVLRLEDSFSILPRPPMSAWFSPSDFALQFRHSLLFDFVDAYFFDALKAFGVYFNRFNRAGVADPRAVFGAAEEFIRGAPAPYFLWVHLYPPHAPYVADPRFLGRFLSGSQYTTEAQLLSPSFPDWTVDPAGWQRATDLLRLRYDEDVAQCDSALGGFIDWMAAGHRDANTIVIVSSDHGENFSGGFWSHGSSDLRYPETHIPLLVSLPGQAHGVTETENGDLSDVAPTILSLLAVKIPSWMEGHPLLKHDGTPPPPQPSFSMYLAQASVFSPPTVGTIAANSGPYRLVLYLPSGHADLFDVADDPEQTHGPVASAPPGVEIELIKDIRRHFCHALGCGPPVCPSASGVKAADAALESSIALSNAQAYFHRGNPKGAEEALRELMQRQPNDRGALLDLGMVLSSEHRYDDAIAIYRQAASGLSHAPDIHYRIALLLHLAGRNADARTECAIALKETPNDPKARALMATLRGGDAK